MMLDGAGPAMSSLMKKAPEFRAFAQGASTILKPRRFSGFGFYFFRPCHPSSRNRASPGKRYKI